MKKKKKFLLAGLCLTVATTVALAACVHPNDGTGTLASTNDVYGMGAVSSVRLLGSSTSVNAVKTFSEVNAEARTLAESSQPTDGAATPEQEVKDQSEKFNEYFTALDSFLGDDIVSTSTVPNTDATYDYKTKMTISGKNFDGETVTYTMYYTETLINSVTEEDDDDDGEETETLYRLNGVMVIDGNDFYLEGERSEESEKNETETELKIRAYADLSDRTSFVQMEQEYSVENGETETEYVYSIYNNGVLTEQTAVDFETEIKNNKVETEYELEFRSGASRGRYLVEREVKDGKTEIKVKYNIDGKAGVFHIREIKDENGDKHYQYSYSDGSLKVFD